MGQHIKLGIGVAIGFLIVGLCVWGVILAVNTSVSAGHINAEGAQAKVQAAQSDVASIKSALDSFRIDCDRYPTEGEGLAALLTAPSGLTDKWKGPYVPGSEVPKDPWGGTYIYQYPGSGSPDSFIIDCPATSEHSDINGGN